MKKNCCKLNVANCIIIIMVLLLNYTSPSVVLSTSALFAVGSGVRQGSCLSAVIFNMFVNKFIVQLKLLDIGCHIGSVFVGCIMYADDIILLCPSLHGLQQMIDTCCNIASLLSLEFNINKFHYIVFGSFYKKNLSPLFVGGNSILSCSTVKYLGVHLVSNRDIKFDLMPSCNSIFMNNNSLNELAVLTLQESYSLSVLMYSIPAMSLSAKQISELGVCWNSVIRKLFITTTNGNLLKVFCMV